MAVSMIDPIGVPERARVISATVRCIERANRLLDTAFEPIPVHFDLIGRTAGMYRVVSGEPQIRYNPYLFAKYYDENVTTTVPHEVAHYLTDAVYGYRNVKPHGREWRNVMRVLGANDAVRCDFDLEGIPVRRYRTIRYVCRCRAHELTSVRHNRVQRQRARYFCRACRTELMPAADE
ncbi:MAG: SprT family zinc-dependent metalloprotease [Gammaproteobacteria bacterium]